MKKAFLTTLFVVAATVANASYLYWQVSSSDTLPATQGTDWNVARVVYSTADADQVNTWNASDKRSGAIGTGYNVIDVNREYMGGSSVGSEVKAPMPTVLYADLGSSASSYSYYVELLNSSTGALYARSDAVTYSELVTAGAVKTELSLGTLASVTPWHAGGYTVVPEPTSAVLMLFGAAFLGLKRKNRSIA